jgi:DNA replication licensing factor MCM3
MADSLLSRFDLIFIILDEKKTDKDKKIAERVCRNHRLAPLVNEWSSQFYEDDDFIIQPIENQKAEESTFEKSNVFRSDNKN